MINSKLDAKKSNTSTKFPLLAKHIDSDLVVLFTSTCIGVVMIPNRNYTYGYYMNGWNSAFDSNIWTILPEGSSVTLTVE